ncbi:MAG: DinB family protein [Terriglobales bacterium]
MPAAMNRPPIWFERKFDFTFPVEQHPNLCARLRGTPARLEEIVSGADRYILVRKPGEEKWSAQEHAGHLLDLEPLWMARVNDYLRDDYLTEASQLTVADLSNRKTFEAQHNQRPIDEILAEFRSSRSRLVSGVEKIEPATFARALLHPRLKTPMRLVDHLYFVAEHDDHHLAHIWELINAG